MLGAIPSCILALIVDFVLGKVEVTLTPEGLKSADKIVFRTEKEKKRRIAAAAVLLAVMLILPLCVSLVSSLGTKKGEIVVGRLNFTEAIVLGNIYSQMIQRHTDLAVKEHFNLNGTMISMSAIANGGIDTFTNYTGVLAPNVLKLELSPDTEQLYQAAKKGMEEECDMQVSRPLGFSNAYVFAITQKTSQKYGVIKLSQLLENASSLRLGCTTAFTQREDLLPKLEEEYDVSFGSVDGLEGNIRYQAIASGRVDVIDAFETDALLLDMELVKIEDDISYFPPCQAVSVTRNETIRKYPG